MVTEAAAARETSPALSRALSLVYAVFYRVALRLYRNP